MILKVGFCPEISISEWGCVLVGLCLMGFDLSGVLPWIHSIDIARSTPQRHREIYMLGGKALSKRQDLSFFLLKQARFRAERTCIIYCG